MAGKTVLLIGAGIVAIAGLAPLALAQRKEAPPPETAGAELIPHLGATLPLDRVFTDATGKKVRLGDYFDGEKPVLLVMVYFRCPSLCTLSLNGLVDALREVDLEIGREFEILTISVDPLETPTLARLKKQSYVRDLGRSSANRGWHFLVGKEADIRAVADAVGFGYKPVEREGKTEYVHQAGIFFLTPKGKVTRCIKDIVYDPRTVKLSLLDASEGKQGSTIDSLISWCFHYDEGKGRYTAAATRIMQLAGAATLLLVALIVVPVWLRSRKKRHAADPNP